METLEEVNREVRERLHPSLTNPSWLVLNKRRQIFEEWAVTLGNHQLSVLDIGGRIQPYRPLLADRLGSYVAVDLRPTALVNIVARAEHIPLVSEQFDLVICTQMLEYVPEPGVVIAEIQRVLRPGGCLWLSVPSVWLRDADEECWRFLPHGLRQLLRAFSRVEVVPEGGSIVGFFRTINACLDMSVRYAGARAIFRRTLCPVINLSGLLLDRLSVSKNDQFAANYSVRAIK
jgi:SAM-dependent methyltransferase